MILLASTLASGAEISANERATLLLVRSLSYDRAVGRENGELRVAVVHDGSATGAEVVGVVDKLRGVTVAGRPIGLPVGVTAADATSWEGVLKGIDAVVVCPGVDRAVAPLAVAARALDVVMLSLEPSYVGLGAALGVAVDGSKLQLRVDIREAKEQGAEFSGELLELAVPVRK